MNNLQTVPRLGVDKFISSFVLVNSTVAAYELVNTLRLEAEEEENYSSFYKNTLLGFKDGWSQTKNKTSQEN